MSNKLSAFSFQLSAIIFSATLLSLAFSSFNLDFLIWFGFVPLFFALEKKEKLPAFFISFLCGFLFFVISMYWLVYVTPAGWIVLSLYQALYFGFFGLFFCFISKSPNYELRTQNYFALPAAWTLLEYIRSNLAGGIGWNLLGYSQYKNLPIIQIADITGVYGVSFLIMLMNVAVYSTIKMAIKCYTTDSKFKIKTSNSFMQDLKSHPAVVTVIVLILFIITLAYGYGSMSSLRSRQRREKQSPIKISVIQGNIPQEFKWGQEYKRQIMNKYEALTKKAAKDNPDLIIWPETAVPGYLNYDDELLQWLKNIIKESKAYFLVGAPMAENESSEKSYNSALLFSDNAKFIEQYDKLHLVLFGEFIPLEDKFPSLRKLFPISGSFIPGADYTVFKLRTPNSELRTNFSVLICFEDIFPSLVRQFVKRGADFMVNITNDAWFGKSCAAYQHAANSIFRAIENRRVFIRSANTGLSCFIDKTGRIYERVSKDGRDLFIDGIKTTPLDTNEDKISTFYTKFGDIFIFCCIILLILGTKGRGKGL